MKKQLRHIAMALIIISISANTLNAQSEVEIDQQIDELLSSGGKVLNLDNIQSSVLNQLTSLLTSQLASTLGSSPISEVLALRGVISESYLKQQKLISSQIEIEQEKNITMTTISPQLANYYNDLGFTIRINELKNKTDLCKSKLVASPGINVSTKDLLIALITKNNNSNELKGRIRTATNQNGQIWMSEAERVQILNDASIELDKKISMLDALNRRIIKMESDFQKVQLRRVKSQNISK